MLVLREPQPAEETPPVSCHTSRSKRWEVGWSNDMRRSDPAVIAELIQVLRGNHPIAYWDAEDELVAAGESAVSVLLGVLPELSPWAQSFALRALGRIGDARAIPTLLQTLARDSGDNDPCIEWFAAEALARIGTPALDPLLVLLISDNAHLRRWSAVALGEMRESRAVESLLERATDSDPRVREAALIAVGQIGVRSAVDALLHLLERSDKGLRMLAVTTLGGCVRGEVFSPLVELMQRPNDLRLPAMYAVISSAGPLALDLLIPFLDDSDPCIRIAVINALGRFGTESAVPLLQAEQPGDRERCGDEGTVQESKAVELGRLKKRLHLP
jgi:HEAT repeat protein